MSKSSVVHIRIKVPGLKVFLRKLPVGNNCIAPSPFNFHRTYSATISFIQSGCNQHCAVVCKVWNMVNSAWKMNFTRPSKWCFVSKIERRYAFNIKKYSMCPIQQYWNTIQYKFVCCFFAQNENECFLDFLKTGCEKWIFCSNSVRKTVYL